MFCTIKFVETIEEVSISRDNFDFLKSICIITTILYITLSLVPIIGSLVALIITASFNFLFIPFILSLDSGNGKAIEYTPNTRNTNPNQGYNPNEEYNTENTDM